MNTSSYSKHCGICFSVCMVIPFLLGLPWVTAQQKGERVIVKRAVALRVSQQVVENVSANSELTVEETRGDRLLVRSALGNSGWVLKSDVVTPPVATLAPNDQNTRPDNSPGSAAEAPLSGGTGTAFIVHPDGYLVTNVHVVRPKPPERSLVEFYQIHAKVTIKGKQYPVRVVRLDHEHDLALIKVDAQGLPALPLTDSDAVQLGEDARAFGYPFIGDQLSSGLKITRGTVSGLEAQAGAKTITTDTAINPGNSGGPLVNDRGEVIAVATAKVITKNVENVGLCVPVNTVHALLKGAGVEVPITRLTEVQDGVNLAKRVGPSVVRVEVNIAHLLIDFFSETAIAKISLSKDGKTLAAVASFDDNNDNSVFLLSTLTGNILTLIPAEYDTVVALTSNGKQVAVNQSHRKIVVNDIVNNKLVPERVIVDRPTQHLMFSPDDSLLASIWNEKIHLFDRNAAYSERQLAGHTANVTSLAFSPNGRVLASFSTGDKRICTWDTSTGALLRSWTTPVDAVALTFTRSGDQLVVHSSQRDTVFYDVNNGEVLRKVKCHGNLFIEPVGNQPLFIAGDFDRFSVFDAKDDRVLLTPPSPGGIIMSAATSADGQVAAFGHQHGLISVISLAPLLEQVPRRDNAAQELRAAQFVTVRPYSNALAVNGSHITRPIALLLKELDVLDEVENLTFSAVDPPAVSELANLSNLRFLSLRRSDTADLKPLSQLKNLRTMYLYDAWIPQAGLAWTADLPLLNSLGIESATIAAGADSILPKLSRLMTFSARYSNFDDRGLEQLGNCEKLEWLYLDYADVSDAGIAQLSRLRSLRSLDLSRTRVTGLGLAQLPAKKSLSSLSLSGTRVTDASLRSLEGMPNLTHIELAGTAVTDAGLSSLGTFSKLDWIDLNRTNVAGVGLGHLASLPVRSLRLAETDIDDEGALKIGALGKLDWLDLSGTRLTDRGLVALGSLENMRGLYVDETAISDDGVTALRLLKKLEYLSVRNTRVSDAGVQNLRNHSLLREINLSGTTVTDASCEVFGALPNLYRLNLSGTQITGRGVEKLAKLSKLYELNLSKTALGGEGLLKLPSFPELTSLNLDDTRVSERGMQSLTTINQLRFLGLNRTQMDDSGLATLAALSSLVSLGLAGTNISDRGAPHLVELSHLQSLDVSKTKLTDAALFHIGKCRSLNNLVVSENGISDVGLTHLGRLPDLSGLSLGGTQVTDAGVASLPTQHPLLQSLHLNDTVVTDAIVPSIKQFRFLRGLNVAKTRLTGVGLSDAVRNVPTLMWLGFCPEQLTDDVIQAISEHRKLSDISVHGRRPSRDELRRIAQLERITNLSFIEIDLGESDLEELSQMKHLRRIRFHQTKLNKMALSRLRGMLRQCEIVVD